MRPLLMTRFSIACRTRFDSGEFGGRRATWTRETNGFVLAVLRCPSAMSHRNPLAPGTVARSPPSPLGLVHIREPFFLQSRQTLTTGRNGPSDLVASAPRTCLYQKSISIPGEHQRRQQFSL